MLQQAIESADAILAASRRLRAEAVELRVEAVERRAQSYALQLRHWSDPCPHLSGGSDASESERVRRLLDEFCAGDTPKTFVGLSSGSVCQACGSPIKPKELEYDIVTSASSLRLDGACHKVFIDSRTDDQNRLAAGS